MTGPKAFVFITQELIGKKLRRQGIAPSLGLNLKTEWCGQRVMSVPRYACNGIVKSIPKLMDLVGLEPRIRCFSNPLMEARILCIQSIWQKKIGMIRVAPGYKKALVTLALFV